MGDTLNLKIFYKRISEEAPGFYFREKGAGYPEEDVAFNASWQTNTRYWLPCKDWPTDKAFVKMNVKVPKNIIAVSNGKLIEQFDEGDFSIFRWQDNHPMATYVITISASKYIVNENKIARYSNPNDSISVKYFSYPENAQLIISGLENLSTIMNIYSQKFGEFPFNNLNFVYVPRLVFSAMSNQTTIQHLFIPNSDDLLVIPHEIAHQWFGSYVNSADWNLWLNEGLSFYAPLLYAAHKTGNDYLRNRLKESLEFALTQDSMSINDGWSLQLNIVLEMMRTTLGDSLYWKSFKYFLASNAYGSATIRDFNIAVNETTGKNYDWFF